MLPPVMFNTGTAGRKDFSTDVTLASNSDALLPTEKAVKAYVDAATVGLLDDRGNYDASSNVFPTTGGSGVAGAVLKGDSWRISVAGTLGGTNVNVNDWIRALSDAPGQTSGNWSIMAQFNNSFTDFDASANPNYPESTKSGERWRITVAGKVGGVSGKTVRVGDTFESLIPSASGTEASVGTNFIVMQGYLPAGTMSLQNADNVNITGGSVSGLITFSLLNSGTGAFNFQQNHLGTLTADRTLTWNVNNSNRIISLLGDLTVPATGTAAILEVANSFTINGAASTPAIKGSGTIFTGGTATTTKPYWLIEPSGTTSTGWRTTGTLLGINAPSGFTSALASLQTNGVRMFEVLGTGVVNFGSVDAGVILNGSNLSATYAGSSTGRASLSLAAGLGSSIMVATGGISANDGFLVSGNNTAANANLLGAFATNTAFTFNVSPTKKDFFGGYSGAGHVLALSGGLGSAITTGGAGGAANLTGGAAAGSGNNNGGDVNIAGGAKTGSGNVGLVLIKDLPTTNPGPGILWNNLGIPAIGT